MLENDPSIESVTIIHNNREKVITFFSGLTYWEPNLHFGDDVDKYKYAAALKHPKFIRPQVKNAVHVLHPMFQKGVVDFDCVKDHIFLKHYPGLGNVGSGPNKEFSFELWIRVRRLPEVRESMAVYCKKETGSHSFYCLTLENSGALHFRIKASITEIVFKTQKDEINPDIFYHIAITGAVGRSFSIVINGQKLTDVELFIDGRKQSSVRSWPNILTKLPADSNGALILGKDPSNNFKHFCGQMTGFYLYDRERSEIEINTEKFYKQANRVKTAICALDLQGTKRQYAVNYYFTEKYLSSTNDIGTPKVLAGTYNSAATPLKAVVVHGNVTIIRQTTTSSLIARRYHISETQRETWLTSDSPEKDLQVPARKGFFSVEFDSDTNTWILIVLDANTVGKLSWRAYDQTFTVKSGSNCAGSMILQNNEAKLSQFVTRPSIRIQNRHLLISVVMGLTYHAAIVDISLKSNGCFEISDSTKVKLPLVGPVANNWGANYYVYLADTNAPDSSTYIKFLRRNYVSVTGMQHITYSFSEEIVDINRSMPSAPINSRTTPNDWSWFMFKISSPNGGTVLQSGQRVLIQTPDNSITNKYGWSHLKVVNKEFTAETDKANWNFVIFKVELLQDGNFRVINGEILFDSEVIFLPSTSTLYKTQLKSKPFPTLTAIQVNAVRTELGTSVFKPWKLLAPPEDQRRPLPRVTIPENVYHPGTVHDGNRLVMLSTTENLKIRRIKPGIWGGVLNFVKTSSAPAFGNSSNITTISLLFRGNDKPSPITFSSQEGEDLYQRDNYVQKLMSPGLFYSIEYTLSSIPTANASIGSLNHVQNIRPIEYPKPPPGFVWLLPPPFKVKGITGVIAQFYNPVKFSVELTKNSHDTLAFYQVIKGAVGAGTFGEGMFKPLLTIPISQNQFVRLSERLKNKTWSDIKQHAPIYNDQTDKFECPEPTKLSTWCILGDLYVSRAFDSTTMWKNKVNIKRIGTRMRNEMKKEWMKNYMDNFYRLNIKPNFGEKYKKFAGFGGFAKVIANNLQNPVFLKELLSSSTAQQKNVIQSQLRILHFLDPELQSVTMSNIMGYLVTHQALIKVRYYFEFYQVLSVLFLG